MSVNFWRCATLALAWSVAVQTAVAATTNLFPVADSAMRDTSPDSGFGTSTQLPVGVSNHGSPINRGLFRFDLSFLPTNAVVNSASLTLSVVQSQTAAAGFSLDRLLVDWSEDGVTWNMRTASDSWTAGGGLAGTDFILAPSATASLGGAGSTAAFSSSGLAGDVQNWINNPGANFGWMLLATGEPGGTGKLVGSREDAGAEPVLAFDYTVPSVPVPPAVSNVQINAGTIQFSFSASAGRTYAVEFTGALSPPSWNSLTNFSAPSAATNFVATDLLTASNRFYRVRTP